MSRESGSERSQRTVAELLAQYGASSEDSAPRRRRRRADEPADTSPQTIIDRVLSDSGEMMAIRDDVEETTVGGQPPVRQQPPTPPPAPSQQMPKRPVQQPPQAGPQGPPPPMPQTGPQPQQQPGPQQLAGPQQQLSGLQQQPAGPKQPSTGPQHPPTGPQQQLAPPVAAPQATATGIRPPVRPGAPAVGRPNAPQPPPRIESSRTNLARADLGRPPQQPQQQPPTGYYRPATPGGPTPPPVDATADTTYLPPITADTPPPNPLGNRLNGAPPQEGVTDVMPRIPASVGESTQAHPGPLVDDDDGFGGPRSGAPPIESTQGHPGPYVDDDDDYEYDYEQSNSFSQYAVDRDAAPAGVGGSLDVEDEEAAEETEGSAGKQWLMMIAQLAIGVVGGAALWLGFQWLWNALPAAALAAAVAVIVALVIVVRRIRKADDLQTMVLAVLVGLIVTVSPAALRLIGH